MIPKITFGNNVDGMVYYNAQKEEKKDAAKAQYLTNYNITGNTTKDIITAIKERNLRNTSVSKPNIHISLNFHQEELINNEKIVEVANAYMKGLGMEEQPYAIYRHYDRKHPHIHIVSSMINLNGKKINDSNIFYRSRDLARKLEKQYGLRETETKKAPDLEINQATGITEHIEIALNLVLEKKPSTLNELNNYLFSYNIEIKKGNKGYFFKFINPEPTNDFNINSIISLNNIKGITTDNLDAALLNNAKEKKEIRKNFMGRLYSVVNAIDEKILLDNFVTQLKKKGISTEIKRIETGDLKGDIRAFIFIDTKSQLSFTASEIGLKTKDFVKDKIVDNVLDEKQFTEFDPKNIIGGNVHYPQYQDYTFNQKAYNTLLNLLTNQVQVLEAEEELNQKKKKKKKRKGI